MAAVLAALLLRHDARQPATDDAYVDADVVGIVAQVAGPIANLAVADNQVVRAGDLLFEIDPRPFRIQVEQVRAELDRTGQDVTALTDAVTNAEAGVRYSQAGLQLAETQWKRVEPLSKIGAIPYQDNDVVFHTDSSLLPRSRKAWASWNYHVPDRKSVV